jgi:outer membrane lipoprotein carrier protein
MSNSLLAVLMVAVVSAASMAAGEVRAADAAADKATATPLDAYLDDMKTLRATFLQTLSDSHGREIDRATGTLIVSRPGKFSWEIFPQGSSTGSGQTGSSQTGSHSNGLSSSSGQLMVADGRNLWFLDRDLQQVTVKPVDAALSATPAMLLSGTVDVRKNFTIKSAPKRDGLDWVLVEPRGSEADFRSALLGFDGSKELKRMILEDKLGQTATVMFDHVERNGPVNAQEVSFTPPTGVDVIGTPAK